MGFAFKRPIVYHFQYSNISRSCFSIVLSSNSSILLHTIRGAIGKQIVVKQYGSKTVITAYPDMSGVKPSKLQKQKRKKFAAAFEYAQSIINDPLKRAAYSKKLKRGARVYNAAIKEFLSK